MAVTGPSDACSGRLDEGLSANGRLRPNSMVHDACRKIPRPVGRAPVRACSAARAILFVGLPALAAPVPALAQTPPLRWMSTCCGPSCLITGGTPRSILVSYRRPARPCYCLASPATPTFSSSFPHGTEGSSIRAGCLFRRLSSPWSPTGFLTRSAQAVAFLLAHVHPVAWCKESRAAAEPQARLRRR